MKTPKTKTLEFRYNMVPEGGSARPLVTEAVLALLADAPDTHIPMPDVKGFYDYDTCEASEFKSFIRQCAIADDPLWRQAMAALSVGPMEFGRFEAERVRALLAWPKLFEALAAEVCKVLQVDEVVLHFGGTAKEAEKVADLESVLVPGVGVTETIEVEEVIDATASTTH